MTRITNEFLKEWALTNTTFEKFLMLGLIFPLIFVLAIINTPHGIQRDLLTGLFCLFFAYKIIKFVIMLRKQAK